MRIRKKLLIYPRFQFTLLGANLLIILVSFATVGLQNYLAFQEFQEIGRTFHLSADNSYFEFIRLQYSHTLSRLAVSFLITTGVSSLITLYVSHEMAGPLIRLKNYFIEIEKNKALPEKELQFRDGDFLSDFPILIKNAFDAVSKKE